MGVFYFCCFIEFGLGLCNKGIIVELRFVVFVFGCNIIVWIFVVFVKVDIVYCVKFFNKIEIDCKFGEFF